MAGFFGVPAMNFVDGELRAAATAAGLRGARAPAARSTGRAAARRRRRRSASGPSTCGLADGPEGWPATVSLIEPLGDETLVFLDYGGPASLVAKVDAEEKVAVGDRRRFALPPRRIVLLRRRNDRRPPAP